MRRTNLSLWAGPATLISLLSGQVNAANTDVGTIVEDQVTGSSTIHVGAADAIRATCGGLVGLAAGDPASNLLPRERDLLTNCGDMAGSILRAYGSDASPGLPNDFGLDSSDPQSVLNSLLQFSGEEVSSQGRFATEASDRTLNTIASRLASIRLGARSNGIAYNINGTRLNSNNSSVASNATSPLIGGNAGESGQAGGFGWFGNASYGFGDRDGTVNEDEFEFDATALTLGVDYAFGNGWVIGGAVSYDSSDIDFDSASQPISQVSGGDIEADGYLFSAFAMFSGETLYYSGLLSFGSHDHDLTRNVKFTGSATTPTASSPDRTLTGSTDSDQTGAVITVGSLLGTGATTVDLNVSFDWLDIEVDRFDEYDGDDNLGLALSYSDQDIESTRGIVSATLRHVVNNKGAVIMPYAGVSWYKEFDNDERIIEARYLYAAPGANPSFATPTDDPDDSYGEVTVGISGQFRNGLFMFLEWDGTIALEDLTSNRFTFGIRRLF